MVAHTGRGVMFPIVTRTSAPCRHPLEATTMSATILDRFPSSNFTPPDELEVSVVMPCLNEALTVGKCVSKAVATLKKLGVAGEVIVADNGSTDGSQALATASGARVVHA